MLTILLTGRAVGWMMEGRGDEKGQLKSFVSLLFNLKPKSRAIVIQFQILNVSQGHYMKLKKDKLLHQVNVLGRVREVSEIFKGISIFVNGYTGLLHLRSNFHEYQMQKRK